MDPVGFNAVTVILVFIFTVGSALEYKSLAQTSVHYVVDEIENAVDGNDTTYTQTKPGKNVFWSVTLKKPKKVLWSFIRISGGQYDIIVYNSSTPSDEGTLCTSIDFTFTSSTYQKNVSCNHTIEGDKIKIVRRGWGHLKLFEFNLFFCESNTHGPECTKCDSACVNRSCSPVSGFCTKCPKDRYGNKCQRTCPRHCESCNQTDGRCLQCSDGYFGQQCNLNCDNVDHESSLKCPGKCLIKCVDNICRDNNGSCYLCTNDEEISCTKKNEIEDRNNKKSDPLLIASFTVAVVLTFVLTAVLIKRLFCKAKRPVVKVIGNTENIDIAPQPEAFVEGEASSDQITVCLEEIPEIPLHCLSDENSVEYMNMKYLPVPVDQFVKEVPGKKENGSLATEFRNIPNGVSDDCLEARKSENKSKNRYKKVYPCKREPMKEVFIFPIKTTNIFIAKFVQTDDYCRVILGTAHYPVTSDYINASYINGFERKRAYIAAQGPFSFDTILDFWTMVWQNNCSRIVMLTKLYDGERMKCLKYWTESKTDIGPFQITLDTQDIYEHYTVRYFALQQGEEKRSVTQFHYTCWPDNGVPVDMGSLLCFRNLVRNGITDFDGPIVVHCSAGIGRTGTFIALDYLLEEGSTHETIDVIGCVTRLRQQRAYSIQTPEQYIFLHEALVEGLTNLSFNCMFFYVDEM